MQNHQITTVEQLTALYEKGPAPMALVKELDHLPEGYQAMIKATSFAVLSTAGPGGLDASPRGGQPGFIKIADAKTLYLPDYKGNNRLDTMRNLLTDPRIGMLLFVPGFYETLRVHGTAVISTDPQLLALFERAPRSIINISVASVFFQCAKAPIRAGLWEPPTSLAELNVVKDKLKGLFESLKEQSLKLDEDLDPQ